MEGSQRLTLNLGLRYEVRTPLKDRNDLMLSLDFDKRAYVLGRGLGPLYSAPGDATVDTAGALYGAISNPQILSGSFVNSVTSTPLSPDGLPNYGLRSVPQYVAGVNTPNSISTPPHAPDYARQLLGHTHRPEPCRPDGVGHQHCVGPAEQRQRAAHHVRQWLAFVAKSVFRRTVAWFQNAGLFKFMNLTEGLTLRFNVDFFNVFNHPNNPTGVSGDGILTTRNSGTGARVTQLSLGLN